MRVKRRTLADLELAMAFALLINPAYKRLACAEAGARSCRVEVHESGGQPVVVTERVLPTTSFPSLVRRFAPSTVRANETTRWLPPGADGSRRAIVRIDFPGTPAALDGTIALEPRGPSTTEVIVDADFRVHVPIVGGRIERVSRPLIDAVIGAELATARNWTSQKS